MTPPTPIEDRLRRTLETVADATEVRPDLDAVVARAEHRRGRPRWVAPVLVAAVLAVVIGAVAVLAADGGDPDRVDVAGPAGPLRVVPGDLPAGLRLVEATAETEMGGGGSRAELWVYAPDDAERPVADPVVAVALSPEPLAGSDLPVKDPVQVSIGGHPASIGEEPDGGWIISWNTTAGEGSVLVLGRGMSRVELMDFASTVVDSGPRSAPDGFRLVFHGADPSFGDRKGVGTTYESPDEKRVEVIVMEWTGFDPAAFIWRPFGAGTARVTEVRGHEGLLIDVEQGSDSLTWLERDDYIVHLSGDGIGPDGLVAVAEGLREVSDVEWRRHVAIPLENPPSTATTPTTVQGQTTNAWLEISTDDNDQVCITVRLASETRRCVTREELSQTPSPITLDVLGETVYVGAADPGVANVRLEAGGRTFSGEVSELADQRLQVWSLRVPDPQPTSGSFVFLDADGAITGDASFATANAAEAGG